MKSHVIKLTILTLIALKGLLVGLPRLEAEETFVADASAKPSFQATPIDYRAPRLKGYLASHNSALEWQALHFVAEADRLGLDWKLVAAIAGVESNFGKRIPPSSYNAWGWGVYTGTKDGVHFGNWKEGITEVSEGLRLRYLNRGLTTVEQIGRTYAASSHWARSVHFFIDQIVEFNPSRPELLPITI